MGLFGGHHSEKQKETLPVRETKIRLPSNDGPARSKSNGTSEITRSGTVLSKDLARRPTQKSTFSSKPTLTRIPSVQTRYMDMLLHLDNIPRLHNIMASAATWILLAGYVILPGTFTTLQDSKVVKNGGKGNVAEDVVVRAIRNAPLLWVGAIFCVIGAVGMISLWIRWRANYVWLINRIFLPGFLNSLTGVISTLTNIFTAQGGFFSITAKVTIAVTGACTVITAILFLLYNQWILEKVKKSHVRDMDIRPEHPEDEGIVEKIHRKAQEPALEPGSVV